jgi:geranylgeranyl diphosphate synthase type I
MMGEARQPSDPVDREDLRLRVDTLLERFVAEQVDVLRAVDEECLRLGEAISDLMAGGKRLRAAFCYWGFRCAGGSPSEDIIAAAAALELFHASALIHDDLMDSSDERRGKPAIHKRFEIGEIYRAPGGSFSRMGLAAGILAGDLCLGWSDELFAQCRAESNRLGQARRVFDEMRTQLQAGQYLDMLQQVTPPHDATLLEQRARIVLHYKSAKYSVEQPLILGAVLAADSTGSLLPYLRQYGIAIGEAFQLRDDMLGIFGNPLITGKPAGNDLREGKRTLLVALASQVHGKLRDGELGKLLDQPVLSDEDVGAATQLITESGAAERIEREIEQLTQNGLAALDRAPMNEECRQVLRDLAVRATRRRS